jgi:hypothetical protein
MPVKYTHTLDIAVVDINHCLQTRSTSSDTAHVIGLNL